MNLLNLLKQNMNKLINIEADQARGRQKIERLEAKLKEMKEMILIMKRQEMWNHVPKDFCVFMEFVKVFII